MNPSDVDLQGAGEPTRVRPYALVRGRTRHGSAAPLPVEAIIVADQSVDASSLQLESAAIVRVCQRPNSVAEISARLAVPVGVVRVLVADLSAEGYVHVNLPLDARAGGTVARDLLERVLAGLEAL